MIKHSKGGGYEVVSETSHRRLSKKHLSKKKAVKRLKQVEYFKHHLAASQANRMSSRGK